MVRREPEEERGVEGTPLDLYHISEKVGLLPTSPTGQLTHLQIRGPLPQTWEHYQRSYQLQCEHYGVDKIALAAKACLFEISFRLLATWRCARWLIYFFNFHLRRVINSSQNANKSNAQRGKEFRERKKKKKN
ncbi:uncharacterized protein TNCV_1189191 [Trichonephila clavipes]|nr:uncharacterized protein TNCV_1189191 [Trichonephila clavipes]